MRIDYMKDMQGSFMLLEKEEEAGESYCEKMLLHNTIAGLLPFEVRRFDSSKQYCFEITGKKSLREAFGGEKLSYQRMRSIVTEALETVNGGRAYLLCEDDFLLLPELLYLDAKQKSFFGYVPKHGKSLREQFAELMEYFMNHADYEEKAAVLFAYRAYMMSKEEDCTFEALMRVVEDCDHAAAEEQEKRMSAEEGSAEEGAEPEEQRFSARRLLPQCAQGVDDIWQTQGGNVLPEKGKEGGERDAERGKADRPVEHGLTPWEGVGSEGEKGGIEGVFTRLAAFFRQGRKKEKADEVKSLYEWEAELEQEKARQETILPKSLPEGETVLLAELKERNQFVLAGQGEQQEERIRIDRFPFVIGKGFGSIDYSISDDTVSRLHVRLLYENGSCMVEDMGSKNGTLVNGRRLCCAERATLREGDELRISNRRYLLKRADGLRIDGSEW